jgi:hypothetical protein
MNSLEHTISGFKTQNGSNILLEYYKIFYYE